MSPEEELATHDWRRDSDRQIEEIRKSVKCLLDSHDAIVERMDTNRERYLDPLERLIKFEPILAHLNPESLDNTIEDFIAVFNFVSGLSKIVGVFSRLVQKMYKFLLPILLTATALVILLRELVTKDTSEAFNKFFETLPW